MAACSAGESVSHGACHSFTAAGPYVSVSPYRWVTLKPAAFIAASTASGGGAAAVKNSTTCGSGFFSSGGALSKVAITIGAPQRCVTLWRAIASYIAGARTWRRHTCVPPTTERVQGKHQPLQWNMGSVQ